MFQENLNARINDRASHLFTAARAGLAIFLALQHDPNVMRFVAENRPLARSVQRSILVSSHGRRAARTGFASPCVIRPRRLRWASRVTFIGKKIVPKSDSSSPLRHTGKVTASNRCGRFAIMPFFRAVFVGLPPPSRREISRQSVYWKKQVFNWKAKCARIITLAVSGKMTGYLAY